MITGTSKIRRSDTKDLKHPTRAIGAETRGKLRVRLASGDVHSFSLTEPGTVLMIVAKRVYAKGTTARGLTAFY